jgi:hypothetical protein
MLEKTVDAIANQKSDDGRLYLEITVRRLLIRNVSPPMLNSLPDTFRKQ